MSYTYRIRCRIEEEGVLNTIKYVTFAGIFQLVSFFQDTFLDLRYSKRFLKGNQKSPFKHLGANDTYHTDYSAMRLIFKHISITPEDVLVDVGCGKGRVINYWLSKKYKNRIIGLELDPQIAQATAGQFSKRDNVRIINGDAISNLPLDGTVFYFYNPFQEEKVRQFEEKLSSITSQKPIKIIYYNPKSLHVFQNDNWNIASYNFERDFGRRRWGRMNKYHDLSIITRGEST